jgi:enediyne biosynthesis protein E4
MLFSGFPCSPPIHRKRIVGAAIVVLFALLFHADAAPLEWEKGDGFRRARLPVPVEGKTGFEKLEATQLGVRFTNTVSRSRAVLNRNLLNGSGVALGDFDGDGWCDIYFCGIDSDNVLYRNLGNWTFEDVTEAAGVACAGQDSTGAVFADVNGDGHLDLLVSSLGRGVRLFLGDGQGGFTEATDESGLRSNASGMTMALADVDGDGRLDLYVTNYRADTIADMPTISFRVQPVGGRQVVATVNGQPVTLPKWTNRFEISPTGRVLEFGEEDSLYLNDGTGKFTRVSFTDGTFLDEDGKVLVEPPRDWGLTVQVRDFTGDGLPDIYVCNDFFTPDRLWVNEGNGRFRAIARTAVRNTSIFSMGVDMADIDRDGHTDMMVVDMISPDHSKRHVQLSGRVSVSWPIGVYDNRPLFSRNTLQRNRGDGTFAEIGFYSGVEASDWSWSPIFLDVDLDGYEDILVSNGVLRDFQNIDMANRMQARSAGKRMSQNEILQFMSNFPTLETSNMLFRNNGDWTFEDVAEEWGFGTPGVSQGFALADLDNDGDLDVVVNNLERAPGFYRNDTIAPRLTVVLKGDAGNPEGVGAKVTVRGGPVEQSQEMISGGHYLSGGEVKRVFAAGDATKLEVEVAWRNGRRSVLSCEPNFIYEIRMPGSEPAARATPEPVKPMFTEVSKGLESALHQEQPFDELGRQPLLLKYLSQLGPGVCWHDYDGDGWEDLIMGSGRGGTPVVLRNENGTNFSRVAIGALGRPAARDQTAVLGMPQGLLAGSSNYEDGSTNGGLIRIYDLQRNVAGDSLLGHGFSCGPLAMADVDGDGDLDLFVGGRAVPGRYPEPADSILFKNEGGKLVPAQRWEKLGMVSGAVFSDLDQDGQPELLLAMEWGPIRVFKLAGGKYVERTRELGLDDYTGWWNGVATGDFTGDGRMEIVASNWGLNSVYRASRDRPRKLYYGDLSGNGTIDLIDARFAPSLGKEAPKRTFDFISAAMPFLIERVPSYEAYGQMSIQEIYGERLARAAVLEATTFESMIFRFQDGKYYGQPLPAEAQLAPAFGICVGDMDGDGNEDLFLSQNFFAVAPSEPRLDAGRGLLLRGDGRGGFTPVPAHKSGILIYGEQRGCALSDFDGDGRVDLAVSQNGNRLKVFRNVTAKPGLRIRLKGPPENPTGVGAVIRIENGQTAGPAREVQAGSGYWSQNGAVQVMNLPGPEKAKTVRVRLPGGKTVTGAIPDGAREIEVDFEGGIRSR